MEHRPKVSIVPIVKNAAQIILFAFEQSCPDLELIAVLVMQKIIH